MKVEKDIRAGPDRMLSHSVTGQEMAFPGGDSKREKSPKCTSAHHPTCNRRQQRTDREANKPSL